MSLLRAKRQHKPTFGAIRVLGTNVGRNLDKSLLKEIGDKDKESSYQNNCFSRSRKRGRDILHSKAILLAIVFLCIVDCILVIGELILDMHAIKAMGEYDHNILTKDDKTNCEQEQDGVEYYYDIDAGKAAEVVATTPKHHKKHHHSIEEQIAHGLHYASISILTVLVFETIIKIISFGPHFLKRKFEIWDAFVVFVSFVLDLVFLEGTTSRSIQESAYILSFILPWRVIRVVNSMIVALFDHEHIKLMLMFKSKQYLNRQIDDMCEDIVLLQKQLVAVKEMCILHGAPEWKLAQTLGKIYSTTKQKKKNALSTLVSTSVGMAVGNAETLYNGSKTDTGSNLPSVKENESTAIHTPAAVDHVDIGRNGIVPSGTEKCDNTERTSFKRDEHFKDNVPRCKPDALANDSDNYSDTEEHYSDAASRIIIREEETDLLCPVPGRFDHIV